MWTNRTVTYRITSFPFPPATANLEQHSVRDCIPRCTMNLGGRRRALWFVFHLAHLRHESKASCVSGVIQACSGLKRGSTTLRNQPLSRVYNERAVGDDNDDDDNESRGMSWCMEGTGECNGATPLTCGTYLSTLRPRHTLSRNSMHSTPVHTAISHTTFSRLLQLLHSYMQRTVAMLEKKIIGNFARHSMRRPPLNTKLDGRRQPCRSNVATQLTPFESFVRCMRNFTGEIFTVANKVNHILKSVCKTPW